MALRHSFLSYLIALFVGAHIVAALQVTPNSPCADVCLDAGASDKSDPNSSNTYSTDITCKDDAYAKSPEGLKFQRCLTCLQKSTWSQGAENDQMWFLYNARLSVANCMFGFGNGTSMGGPCITSTACGGIQKPVEDGSLKTNNLAQYAYCDADGSAMTGPSVSKCLACIAVSKENMYMANYIVALEAGCKQRPAAGQVIGLNATVFSKTLIGEVDPATTTTASAASSAPSIPTTTIVVIVIGIVLGILLIAGFCYMHIRKRRARLARTQGNGSQGHRHGHRPVSSLSFRCQTHLSPRSPHFFDSESGPQEKHYIDPAAALSSNPISPVSPTETGFTHNASPLSAKNPHLWNPANSVSQYSSVSEKEKSFGAPASLPLRDLHITTPAYPSRVQQSPRSNKFSPISPEDVTPASTTSTRSTSALLPLKPYNPADYAVAAPALGGVHQHQQVYSASPTSGTTTSPLLSRQWADRGKPSWDLPVVQSNRPAPSNISNNPYKNSNFSSPTLPPRPSPDVKKIDEADIGVTDLGGLVVPFPPPGRGSTPSSLGRKPSLNVAGLGLVANKTTGISGGAGRRASKNGSPVESREINFSFPAPPTRR